MTGHPIELGWAIDVYMEMAGEEGKGLAHFGVSVIFVSLSPLVPCFV